MPDENEQPSPIDPLTIGELISIKEASQQSGLNSAFLSQLAKKGRLKAKKMGRDWFTTMEAVEAYLQSRHRGKRTDIDKSHLDEYS